MSDLEHLILLPKLSTLDLSYNKIDFDCSEEFLQLLEKLPKLAVLYLVGNNIIKKIKNYRKVLIARLKNLKYLDDRPVFKDDRRYSEAFLKGGLEEEKKERKKVKQEQQEFHKI